MRSSRHVVLSLAAMTVLALTPSAGAAQSATQGFADSWYWGAYGGVSYFTTTAFGANLHNSAPSVGVDWMLTRTKFALNVFADQSYFNATSSVLSPTGLGPLPVSISDMRRFGFAAMFFTPEIREFKPYVGLGYSFNFINSASLNGSPSFPTQAAADSNQRAVVDARAMGKVFANVGVMLIAKRFAPFAQFTVMPTQGASDWFLNGAGFTTMWAVGLRYNFGTSIEKW
jgi:outer membrane protein W